MTNNMISELKQIIGDDGVLAEKGERAVYENDAYPLEKAAPLATVLPRTTAQVSEVVKVCARHNVPFAPRGAGTGLAGGTLCPGGVLIGVARMNRILDIDLRNRRLTAQAGAVNIALTKAVAAEGYLYAPDPSSQGASTLGGNIANNAGGPHTLKYGVTANHVLAVELVLPDGEVVTLGDKHRRRQRLRPARPGPRLRGHLRHRDRGHRPSDARARSPSAPCWPSSTPWTTPRRPSRTSSPGGITPAALEMMDAVILQTVEDAFHFGFPRDAGAILIIELDGLEAGLEAQADRVRALCAANAAREVRQAQTPKDRANLWAARKKAVGTLGRLALRRASPRTASSRAPSSRPSAARHHRHRRQVRPPHRQRLPRRRRQPAPRHPLFDERNPDEVKRVMAASHEILELCIGVGGTLTGEHGIGVEKRDHMPLLFPPETLRTMEEVRAVFNPLGLCNPGKVLPTSHGCAYDFQPRTGAVSV